MFLQKIKQILRRLGSSWGEDSFNKIAQSQYLCLRIQLTNFFITKYLIKMC